MKFWIFFLFFFSHTVFAQKLTCTLKFKAHYTATPFLLFGVQALSGEGVYECQKSGGGFVFYPVEISISMTSFLSYLRATRSLKKIDYISESFSIPKKSLKSLFGLYRMKNIWSRNGSSFHSPNFWQLGHKARNGSLAFQVSREPFKRPYNDYGYKVPSGPGRIPLQQRSYVTGSMMITRKKAAS